jgi:hypothetical protein
MIQKRGSSFDDNPRNDRELSDSPSLSLRLPNARSGDEAFLLFGDNFGSSREARLDDSAEGSGATAPRISG